MLTHFIGQNDIRGLIVQDAIAAEKNNCQVRSKHMLLHLNEGNGRTTLLRYMTEVFEDYHVRRFLNLDTYIEERLPPTLNELRALAMRIGSKAVFANYFSGVIALDASGLYKCLNDVEYMNTFRQMVANLREHAMLIFFLPESSNNKADRIEQLLEELCEQFSAPDVTEAFVGDIVQEREKGIDKPSGNMYNLLVDVLPLWRKDVPLNFGGRPHFIIMPVIYTRDDYSYLSTITL